MPRTDMSPAEKVKLLDKMKEHPQNTSVRALAELLNVPRATIGRLRRHEAEIRLQAQTESSQKRRRDGKNPEVEQALLQWYQVMAGRGVNVSGPILLKTAEELALKLGYTDFKATDGWLSRWKKRHNVKLKKFQSAKTAADEWRATIVPEISERFSRDNIYSAGETGLYYRATPDGSLNFQKDDVDLASGTILCCVNMTGSDKRKLVMIEKTQNVSLEGMPHAKLPVEYVVNSSGWITPEIFTEWLTDWDRELQRQSKFVALLVADCAPHPKIDYLQNITLVFLPSILASPVTEGIIQGIKSRYKRKLVEFILSKISEKCVRESTSGRDIGGGIDLDQVMNFLAESWNEVSPRVVRECFSDCGFKIADEMDANADEESTFSVLSIVTNCGEFLTFENGLKCYDESEKETAECVSGQEERRMDESIVGGEEQTRESEGEREGSRMDESVVEREEQTREGEREESRMDESIVKQESQMNDNRIEESTIRPDESKESRMDELELPHVSVNEAKACIERLRTFFMQKGNEFSPMSALEDCYNYVAKLANEKPDH